MSYNSNTNFSNRKQDILDGKIKCPQKEGCSSNDCSTCNSNRYAVAQTVKRGIRRRDAMKKIELRLEAQKNPIQTPKYIKKIVPATFTGLN